MIISNSHEFVYVHLAKTGGTTITGFIEPQLHWNDIAIGGSPLGELVQPYYRDKYGMHKHSTAAEVREVVGSDLWDQYTTFATIRHPYPRAVSHWTWAKHVVASHRRTWSPLGRIKRVLEGRRWRPGSGDLGHLRWPVVEAVLETSTFSDFLRHPSLQKASRLLPQATLLGGPGPLLVDHALPIETLSSWGPRFFSSLGLEWRQPSRQNVSAEQDWRQILRDPADFALLRDRYAPDFDVFDYDHGLAA